MSPNSPPSKARRASHQRIKPKIRKQHIKVIFFADKYFNKHNACPTNRELAEFSGIDILTTGARLSELRTEHGLIVGENNPEGNRYGCLNKLTELAHMMIQTQGE